MPCSPPYVQFSLSLSKTRGSLCKMKTRCKIVWQESQHRFYTVAAGKRMWTQVGKCCKIRVKRLRQNYNRALGTGKLS